MKDRTIKFGERGMEEVEEEIFGSSKLNSSNNRENKEVSHVSVRVVPRCVDLTKDQFPEMMDRMPSRVNISSPIKVGSIKATNPLVSLNSLFYLFSLFFLSFLLPTPYTPLLFIAKSTMFHHSCSLSSF